MSYVCLTKLDHDSLKKIRSLKNKEPAGFHARDLHHDKKNMFHVGFETWETLFLSKEAAWFVSW